MTEQTRTIQQSVTINAPGDAVFKALTDANELIRWFPTTAESDPRTGGNFKYFIDNPSHPERTHIREGTYLEVNAHQKLHYPWHMPEIESTTEVAFTVEGHGSSTHVALVHGGWPTSTEMDETVQMHTDGWQFFLQNLKAVLEGGQDQREKVTGMRTTVAA